MELGIDNNAVIYSSLSSSHGAPSADFEILSEPPNMANLCLFVVSVWQKMAKSVSIKLDSRCKSGCCCCVLVEGRILVLKVDASSLFLSLSHVCQW